MVATVSHDVRLAQTGVSFRSPFSTDVQDNDQKRGVLPAARVQARINVGASRLEPVDGREIGMIARR